MLSDADRAKYPLPAKPPKPMTLIDKADAIVDIRDIMRQMKLYAPEGTFYSYKINCPWAEEHDDSGLDKNCRLFGSTNIYCWAMHGYITPTYLYSRWKHVPREKAAETLLDERGLLNKPWRQRWNDLVDYREEKRHTRLGNKQDVVAALHAALRNDETYIEYEFSAPVRQKWAQVLKAMDSVWEFNIGFDALNDFYGIALQALKHSATLAGEGEKK